MAATITIKLGDGLPEQSLINLLSSIWMLTQAVAKPAGVDFEVQHGGPAALSQRLNAEWERYGRDVRWK